MTAGSAEGISRRGRGALAAVIVVVAVTLINRPRGNDPPAPLPPPATAVPLTARFVGSDACRVCHEEIFERYAAHPMSQALRKLEPGDVAKFSESGPGQFSAAGRTYRIERRGPQGPMLHVESMADSKGKVLYEQVEPIDYVIGAGVKGRSFLLKRGGLFFQSPLSYYTRKARWDLSPGFPAELHYRFTRRVGNHCLSCHSGQLVNEQPAAMDRFSVETPFLEEGIGCERCHGPGSAHVAAYQETEGDLTETLIVNPARLSHERQQDVCNQCHLEGKVRIPRQGHRFADYRPGEPLSETWTVFVGESPFDEEGRPLFTSHVEQMNSSRCFQGSQGRLGCTSCHDPHGRPPAEQAAAFYRERCNRCHAEQGCRLPESQRRRPPALGSCIHCHMPRVHSRDVAHTTQANHAIVRRPSLTSRQARVEREAAGEPWHPFGRMGIDIPEEALARAKGLAWFRQAVDTKDSPLMEQARVHLEESQRRNPDDLEVLRTLGFLAFRSQQPDKARRLFETVLKQHPDDEGCLSHLLLICFLSRDDKAGVVVARRLLALNPWDGEAHGPYADMLEATGPLEAAIAAAERGLALDPTVLDMRRSLARFYRKAGREEDAAEQERLAREIGRRLESSRTDR
ncbi:MAG: hypothetical protein CMJ65_06965 [Planctomycetaceae bacterium]|nr:hypothetical protein [Planctomycetaceae bacterium]MDP7276193.1 cytochrome c3 family protein [Planctomycetaceae bacterium]